MFNYINLSRELESKILFERQNACFTDFSFLDSNAIRRIANPHDAPNVIRSNFIRDVDKILNCPFYNRYADKTQVFSFNKNDDITHRSLHVQLVSRIARTIGKALNLNLELIEAIALGHDIGHTPFGHMGEKLLDKLYFSHTCKHFSHNIHSVRVLDVIFPLNLTLQTLDGIACHNGEIELCEYSPSTLNSFDELDKSVCDCYDDLNANKKLIPSTLEGCVMRISDIIAYLGKDRQDAVISNVDFVFNDFGIGKINAEIVNNLMVSIIENSYDKGKIVLPQEIFDALCLSKSQNYKGIYNDKINVEIEPTLSQMMAEIYEKLLDDLENTNKYSPVYKHHVDHLNDDYYAKKRALPYEKTEINQIVVDYIASMTDDYFIDLYKFLFPTSNLEIKYKGYFNNYYNKQ